MEDYLKLDEHNMLKENRRNSSTLKLIYFLFYKKSVLFNITATFFKDQRFSAKKQLKSKFQRLCLDFVVIRNHLRLFQSVNETEEEK